LIRLITFGLFIVWKSTKKMPKRREDLNPEDKATLLRFDSLLECFWEDFNHMPGNVVLRANEGDITIPFFYSYWLKKSPYRVAIWELLRRYNGRFIQGRLQVSFVANTPQEYQNMTLRYGYRVPPHLLPPVAPPGEEFGIAGLFQEEAEAVGGAAVPVPGLHLPQGDADAGGGAPHEIGVAGQAGAGALPRRKRNESKVLAERDVLITELKARIVELEARQVQAPPLSPVRTPPRRMNLGGRPNMWVSYDKLTAWQKKKPHVKLALAMSPSTRLLTAGKALVNAAGEGGNPRKRKNQHSPDRGQDDSNAESEGMRKKKKIGGCFWRSYLIAGKGSCG
jgi:hypothetical protein